MVNVVDVDSKDLLSSWILMLSVTTPAIGRKYDVEVFGSKVVHKKIVFKNPWDVPRRFILTSSDEEVMQPR